MVARRGQLTTNAELYVAPTSASYPTLCSWGRASPVGKNMVRSFHHDSTLVHALVVCLGVYDYGCPCPRLVRVHSF